MPDNKADLSSPTGSASPGSGVSSRRVVERLDEPECMELLSTARIGRLVYNSRYGLVAVPSEYKIHEGSIVFRTYQTIFTEEDLRTGIAYAEYKVAMEVDQTDPDARVGWVVVVQGAAHHIDTEAERAAIAHLGLESWVEGEPEHFIRVIPSEIGGQRIRPA
jgi:nitroimidazol reductase NimA-like FMN-containing flavoprotein (pyridoxamine 5'-phosphate oxidase superfamily)